MRYLTTRRNGLFTLSLAGMLVAAGCPITPLPGQPNIVTFTATPAAACDVQSGGPLVFTLGWNVGILGKPAPDDVDQFSKIELRVLDSSQTVQFRTLVSENSNRHWTGTRSQPFSGLSIAPGKYQWQLVAMWEDGSHQHERKIPFEVADSDDWIVRPVTLKQADTSARRFGGDLIHTDVNALQTIDRIRVDAEPVDAVTQQTVALEGAYLSLPTTGSEAICMASPTANVPVCRDVPTAPVRYVGRYPESDYFDAFFVGTPPREAAARTMIVGLHLVCR